MEQEFAQLVNDLLIKYGDGILPIIADYIENLKSEHENGDGCN